MRQQVGRTQRTTHSAKWITSLFAGAAASFLALPAHAQTVSAVGGSTWVTATIISVSAVFVLWGASVGASALALKMRWISRHRHNRLSRGLQVVFGGLLLTAVLMPYLAMNHPVLATGLLITGVLMTVFVGSRSRQLQGDSN